MKRSLPTIGQLAPKKGLKILWYLRRGACGLPEALEALRAELGDIFHIKFGRFERIIIGHPEGLRQALVEKREAFAWRVGDEPVVRLLRRGLLVQDGEAHLGLRRTMEPSNRRRHFLPKLPSLYPLVETIIQRWENGRAYDMMVEMRKIALVAFEWIYFSHDIRPELSTLWKPILDAVEYIGPGIWLFVGPTSPPSSLRILDRHLYTLIEERQQTSTLPDDMLTHLISTYSDNDLIRDQMLTMLIAGHDTSTAALAWTLHLLSIHADWQNRLREEVTQAFGKTPPSPEKVSELPLLDAFLKETLRLYPPIHAGNRLVRENVDIMGYTLRAGQKVLLSYYLAQRHPEFWEERSSFRPQRWLEGKRAADTFSYIPFSGGPRMCIGALFAQVELRMIVAYLLQRYTFSPVSQSIRARMGATLEPYPGVKLLVRHI